MITSYCPASSSPALAKPPISHILRRLSLLLGCLFLGVVSSEAQTAGVPSKPKPAVAATNATVVAVKKARPIPFRGTLASFNLSAKTLTVGKRTFVLTSETKLYKGEAKTPATIHDARVGLPVTGSYLKSSEGKLLARSIFFKPPKTAAVVAPAKENAAE